MTFSSGGALVKKDARLALGMKIRLRDARFDVVPRVMWFYDA
ncbi:hypothetical protein NSU_4760 [Novosphingobium pentaromativorans US6-1]|uniref:Uncharacterized protein n=1 Tax=Novosphingobium pentaromativorans US6-1 TaxID=1088721 RepID=G6EK89_9SPHN|nr:hypothetical protein NSU_4760 [Novosphingobium pentaromativorans US6-1]